MGSFGSTVEDQHYDSEITLYRKMHLDEAKESLLLALEHCYVCNERDKIERLVKRVEKLIQKEKMI